MGETANEIVRKYNENKGMKLLNNKIQRDEPEHDEKEHESSVDSALELFVTV